MTIQPSRTGRTERWLRRVSVMTVKELIQLWRDPALIGLFAFAFTAAIVSGGQQSVELRNAFLTVADADHTATSRELTARFQPPYYSVTGEVADATEGARQLDRGESMVLLEIPAGFERAIAKQEPTAVMLQVDTTMALTGLQATAYAQQIARTFALERGLAGLGMAAGAAGGRPMIRNETRVWFNPNQQQSWFWSISELIMMISLLTILLSTAAMAREKERGTIDQLLVSPLTPVQIMLPKILAMTFVVVAGSMLSVFVVLGPVFHVHIRGSLLLFFGITALYAFATTGLGLLAATLTRNLSQAGLLAVLLFLPIVLVSGIHTPIEVMSRWFQVLVSLNPLAHYIDLTYGILLRGAGLDIIWKHVLYMASLGGLVFGFSVWRFRRQFE